MTTIPVIILGGSGNFGKRIARALAARGHPVVMTGRNSARIAAAARAIGNLARPVTIERNACWESALRPLAPAVVVNATGPFQGCDYAIPLACIRAGLPMVDLADGREYVTGIGKLDSEAKQRGVPIISGASTVPALSSAVLTHFAAEFANIETLQFGISPGQQAERGLATTRSILSYVGKPLAPFSSANPSVYGWQTLYRHRFPEMGKRWMANCDIPDLDLLPARYGIRRIQFSAGLELSVLHVGLWALSVLVRAGLPLPLHALAPCLLAISNAFNRFGTADGGMFMDMHGTATDGARHRRIWHIVGRQGHGPEIPAVPAMLLASRLAGGEAMPSGAYPCLGLVPLPDYLDALDVWDISCYLDYKPWHPRLRAS